MKPKKANSHQIGGDHYNIYGDLQPWDTFLPWRLNGFQAHILVYLVRYREKNGIEDLKKARHFLDKFIEEEEKLEAAMKSGKKLKALPAFLPEVKLRAAGLAFRLGRKRLKNDTLR